MSSDYVPKSKRVALVPLISWKERAAAAIAMMVVKRVHFEKKDLDELETRIKKMLDEFEEEWG